MKTLDLDKYIKKIPDFPKKGVLFYDITGILTSPEAFTYCIDCMIDIYKDRKIDAVAATEARGFLFSAPFAYRMGVPLILIRKKGKLPGETVSRRFTLEYAESEIEVHLNDVPVGKRVLLMDDLIATGGTLQASKELITLCGGIIPEVFGVIGLSFLNFEKKLAPTPVRTLINYNSE